jgi:hypothetical protein
MPTETFRIVWLIWLLSLAAAIMGFITTFLIIEIWALIDPQKGDTLTETVRSVLAHPFSLAWIFMAAFFVLIVGLLGWLIPHILGMGKFW